MQIPVRKGFRRLKNQGGKTTAMRTALHLQVPLWNTLTSRRPIGKNIFGRDWDLLVILDTCRPDTLRQISDDYSSIDAVESMRSVGSMSAEWMLNTFRTEYREEIAKTAFVSGNIWSDRIFNERFHKHQRHGYDMIHRGRPHWQPVEADAFAHYETVSAVANQGDRLHPENEAIPHILTDRTIAVGRNVSHDRLIVHYTLPHLTFIADALAWSPGERSEGELMGGLDATRELRAEERSYGPVRRGEVSPETVRQSYVQNLRLGLDYVNVLLRNVDAETAIISADHGEALGEYGLWGHPWSFPGSPVKEVPWARTTATDERTYEPRYEPLERSPTAHEREQLLRDMGYL